MWKVLALATTFAGNLTIIGSVANMIVVESAREHLEIGFWDYARFGIPITVLTIVAVRCGEGMGIDSSESILIQCCESSLIFRRRRV